MKNKNLLSSFVFVLVLAIGSLAMSATQASGTQAVAAKKCNCVVENTNPKQYGRHTDEHCVDIPCWRPIEF